MHVFQLTVMQVLHHVGLVDSLNRAKPHGDRGELPVVRHQPRVRVGRKAIAVDFTTELVHLLFGQAAFQEGARIDTWCHVALNVNQVAFKVAFGGAEEVVETHLQ